MQMVLVTPLADFTGSANGYSHAHYLAGSIYEMMLTTAEAWIKSGRIRLLTEDEIAALDQAIADEVAHQAKAELDHQPKAEAPVSSELASKPARTPLTLVETPPHDFAEAVEPVALAAALIADATPPPPIEPAPPAEVVQLKPRKRNRKGS